MLEEKLRMIQKISNWIVNLFLIVLATISLIGAVGQLVAMQGMLSVKKNIIYTFLIILGVFIYIFWSKIKSIINRILLTKRVYFITFLAIWLMLIIYQLNMIESLTGTMDLDPAFLYNLILNKPTIGHFSYSWCPNLLLLLNLENAIYHILGNPSIYMYLKDLNYINMLLIDISLILIYFTVKKQINRKYAFFTFLVGIALFGITPYIAIPYSDNWAFWICSLYIFLLSTIYDNGRWNTSRPIVVVFLGIIGALFFKIKPSTAISLIATVLILLVISINKGKKLVSSKTKVKHFIKALLLFIIPFSLTYSICNYYANNNGLVKIEKGQGASPLHFMAMGLHGDGQYWESFNNKDWSLPKSERKSYDIKIIKQDIRELNSLSSIGNFIITKQQHNSSLASWQRNTGPVSWNLSPKLKLKNNFQKELRKIFVKNNFFYWNGYLIFVQLVWVIVILLIILSYPIKDYFVQILKYTIVGGFLFLLLFEGGVSRYMIQYLPFIITLVPYGALAIKMRSSK